MEKISTLETLSRFLSCFDSNDAIAILENMKELSKDIRIAVLSLKTPLFQWKTSSVEQRQKAIEEMIGKYRQNRYEHTIAMILEDLNIAVIDIDNAEKFENEVMKIDEFLDSIKQDALVIEKSLTKEKGYHIYVRNDILHSYLKTWPNNKIMLDHYGFEIRYQGLIICYPSKHIKDDKDYQTKLLFVNKDNINKTKYDSDALQEIIRLCNLTIAETDYNLLQQEQKIYQERTEEAKKYKITNEVIQQIKERVKITDIASNLRRKQGYWLTNCPLHPPDRNPSFAIKDYNGIQKGFCFHEWKSLDIIDFYKAIHNVDFKTAIIELSKIAGIELEEKKEEILQQLFVKSNIPSYQEKIDNFVKMINTLISIQDRQYYKYTASYKNEYFMHFIDNFDEIKERLINVLDKIQSDDDFYGKMTFLTEQKLFCQDKEVFLLDFVEKIASLLEKANIEQVKHVVKTYTEDIFKRFPVYDACNNENLYWIIKDNKIVMVKNTRNGTKELVKNPIFVITHRLIDQNNKVAGYRIKKDNQVFDIPYNFLDKSIEDILSKHGITIAKNDKTIDYLISYYKQNQEYIPDLTVVNTIGWHDNKYYLPQLQPNVEFTTTLSIESQGQKEKEIELMKKIFQQETPMMLGYVLGFASTLIYPLSLSNVVCFISGNNATGKTTIANVANSIFGNYKKLFLTMLNTRNAREYEMAERKDIVTLLDEANLIKDKDNEIVNLIYEFAAGQGKARLTKELKRREKLTYRGILLLTSEESMNETIERIDHTTAGIVRRSIEIRMSEFTKNHSLFSTIYESIENHYGNMIKDWIDFVIQNKKMIETIYKEQLQQCVAKKLGNGMDRNFALFYTTIHTLQKCFNIDITYAFKIMNTLLRVNIANLQQHSSYDNVELVNDMIEEFILKNNNKAILLEYNEATRTYKYSNKTPQEIYFIQHTSNHNWYYFTALGLKNLAKFIKIDETSLKKILINQKIAEPDEKNRIIKKTLSPILPDGRRISTYLIKMKENPIDPTPDNDTDTTPDNFVEPIDNKDNLTAKPVNTEVIENPIVDNKDNLTVIENIENPIENKDDNLTTVEPVENTTGIEVIENTTDNLEKVDDNLTKEEENDIIEVMEDEDIQPKKDEKPKDFDILQDPMLEYYANLDFDEEYARHFYKKEDFADIDYDAIQDLDVPF